MHNEELSSLLDDLLGDMHRPDVLWQIAVLLACLVVAWLVARMVRARQRNDGSEARRLERGVRRVAFPLVALALAALARLVLHRWMHVNLLSLAVPLLASLAGIRAAVYVLRVSFAPSGWVAAFERSFALVVWLGAALYIVGFGPALVEALEGVSFSAGRQHLNLWMVLQGAATVVVTLFLALWVSSLIERRLLQAEGIDDNLRVVFTRLSKSLLSVVAVLIALPMVGIDLTTLSVFGGALGVGLGFGLQKIASNYVAGFIILLDHSIRIGNVITVGADRGQVTKITTRYTVLRNLTGVEAIVPNEVLVSSVVQNESYTDPRVRVALAVQVGYSTDVEQAMQLMVGAARSQPRVLVEPPPMALCQSFGDSGINLEVGFWIADPHEGTGALRSEINLEILRRFRAAGIEIPFPQREVRVLGTGQIPPSS